MGLKRDSVIPANEIMNTLQGDFPDIPIQVEATDFPYRYSHVVPFPASAPEDEVEAAFDFVFSRAGEHLRR